MKRPFFLITNDDGIHAPGIYHLWEAVHEFADVAIVAPLTEKSGSGLSITWAKPLRVQSVTWEKQTPAWSVSGTPADCVKMACSVILDRKPDMVLSGINRGSNSGRTILYSGTVGGVIEGINKHIPGIAFSFADEVTPPVSATKEYIQTLIAHTLEDPLPLGTFFNVTFPLNCKERTKGLKMAKQGSGYWVEAPDKRIHPEGLPYYWLGGAWSSAKEDPEGDVALLEEGYITVVPIHVHQMTDLGVFNARKEAIEGRSQLKR